MCTHDFLTHSPHRFPCATQFVSGPLSRSGMVGFIGTALHVGAWLCALIFDLVLATQIDSEQAPGAWTLWVWGYTSLMIGFVALVIVTLVHAFSSDDYKIPEGGAPPFLMTLFISGAQISLILTILGIVASVGGTNTDFLYINDTALTVDETRAGKLHAMRNLMVWSMISKAFVVGFIRNNQEWAGPANGTPPKTTTLP